MRKHKIKYYTKYFNMKFRNFYLVFTLLLLISIPSSYAQSKAGMSLERLKRYDTFLQKEIDEGKITGATFLVQRKGEMVYQNALGYNSKDKKTPMKTDNLFFIQSMTKPIITAAFMMLYEEGHFLLNDPVSMYLPEFKNLQVCTNPKEGKGAPSEPLKRQVTIANLLSHTAGFSHGLGPTKLDEDVAKAQYFQPHANIQARVSNLTTLPLIGHPGEQWYYSAAPDVLSVLIEKFSGMPTNEFLQKRIFDPLGMKDTGYNLPKSSHARVTPVYSAKGKVSLSNDKGEAFKVEGNTIWSGVNGLFSTTADYAKFCQMMLNKGELNGKRLLSPKTVELMTMNQVGDLYPGPGVGFGFGFAVITDVADNKLYGSEGVFYWSGAFNTHFFIDPKEELVAVFMTQLDPYTQYYHNKLRQYVYQSIVD